MEAAARFGSGSRSSGERCRIGVLGLQGGVAEHIESLRRLDAAERAEGKPGVQARPVKLPSDLAGLDGLILPGGESSAVGKLLTESGMLIALRTAIADGLPAWGTCMGAILLARDLENDGRRHLGLMDIRIRRNAYGGQLDSFKTSEDICGMEGGPFPLVFIRAPIIVDAGAEVSVLARVRGDIVACREGHLLATTFHPELTGDTRFHAYFADMVRSSARVKALSSPGS